MQSLCLIAYGSLFDNNEKVRFCMRHLSIFYVVENVIFSIFSFIDLFEHDLGGQ
jgi:hypothetical protein